MRFSLKKFSLGLLLVLCLAGGALAFAKISSGWRLYVNGKASQIPIHVMNDQYVVSLSDLAKLPGWKVTMDLGARIVSLSVPGKGAQRRTPEAQAAPSPAKPENVETEKLEPPVPPEEGHGGPPNNVRMTVRAALTSLDELRKTLASDATADALKQKRDATIGLVQQANNLLWSLPRTRTLQADLQVALEDLQSQINLALVLDQTKDGLLPWTHPTAQNLLLKYPDLHPCRITKGKIDGLDVACAKKMLTDLSTEDFNDVERDLEQYK